MSIEGTAVDGSLDDLAHRFSVAEVLTDLPRVIDLSERIPLNPPGEIQQKFVGASFEPAYREAGRFIAQATAWASHEGSPLERAGAVLDFGAGWGRISRMLLASVPSERLYAMDVDQRMVALVGSTLPGVNCLVTQPFPPTVLGDGALSHAFAFSVFSHLSEAAHAAWAAEFGRLLAPGGLVFITVLDELFFAQIAACQAEVAAGSPSAFAVKLAGQLEDPAEGRRRYDDGDFVYCAGGKDDARTGDFYGWAAAPRQWVRSVWGAAGFEIVHWVPSGELFEQSMVCLRRTRRPWLLRSKLLIRRVRPKGA